MSLNANTLNNIAAKLANALPASITPITKEIQNQFRRILQENLQQLNIVSREEFDIQVKVLAKTRQKIESLEKKLDTLLINN